MLSDSMRHVLHVLRDIALLNAATEVIGDRASFPARYRVGSFAGADCALDIWYADLIARTGSNVKMDI